MVLRSLHVDCWVFFPLIWPIKCWPVSVAWNWVILKCFIQKQRWQGLKDYSNPIANVLQLLQSYGNSSMNCKYSYGDIIVIITYQLFLLNLWDPMCCLEFGETCLCPLSVPLVGMVNEEIQWNRHTDQWRGNLRANFTKDSWAHNLNLV